jgi:hypothetical protein
MQVDTQNTSALTKFDVNDVNWHCLRDKTRADLPEEPALAWDKYLLDLRYPFTYTHHHAHPMP